MLKIYDSLSGKKREFKPVTPGEIKIYACGQTVYDYCHIGHARSMIVFDTIVRYLRVCGNKVTYVRNITDIDDKIIKRANENKETCEELTQRFIDIMHEDEKALGLMPVDHEPRATAYVNEIIALIQKLMDEGVAYQTDNGDVCFEVRKFKEYGRLAKRDLEKLISGARVSVEANKRSPLDFVLWKQAKPGEPEWSSPWGKGRPGWHIECSAMASEILGQPFDIHGGGMDLKFPHHENEIAQSEAAHHKTFANYWMHAGLLTVNDEKMSKSLNNFFTIQDVLKDNHPEVIRYFMLSSHYRSPVNYSKENLTQARQALTTLYTAMRGFGNLNSSYDYRVPENAFKVKFHEAMEDDFNTSVAFSVLFDLAHEINRLNDSGGQAQAEKIAQQLRFMGGVLGILQDDPEIFLQGGASEDLTLQVETLIAARKTARIEKNWAEADRIRDELTQLGVTIEDGAKGTTWRKV